MKWVVLQLVAKRDIIDMMQLCQGTSQHHAKRRISIENLLRSGIVVVSVQFDVTLSASKEEAGIFFPSIGILPWLKRWAHTFPVGSLKSAMGCPAT